MDCLAILCYGLTVKLCCVFFGCYVQLPHEVSRYFAHQHAQGIEGNVQQLSMLNMKQTMYDRPGM